jgi:lipoprotein-releasing system permease protein
MNFPFYIAKRYLSSRKSRTAINIISLVSVLGVTMGTMALVVVLSVFNGFDHVIKSLISSFDPDVKISLVEGKVFDPSDAGYDNIIKLPGVERISSVLEENALIKYEDRQYIATLKGVDTNYMHVNGIDTMMVDGDFILEKDGVAMAVLGQGVAWSLRVGLTFTSPLVIYMPKRLGQVNPSNPMASFNRYLIWPSGFFGIEQDYDSKYILLPLQTVRELTDYPLQVSALEIKIKDGYDEAKVLNEIKQISGGSFNVLNRFQQNEIFYRIMRSEKWAIFFILSLILLIASFNIIASLTMLIIEKKDDIETFRKLGAQNSVIRQIFLTEGWLISIIGSGSGLILGIIISFIQQEYEIIKLAGSGSFVIDAYPVKIYFPDLILIWLTVMGIGFLTAYYPVRKIRSFINNKTVI